MISNIIPSHDADTVSLRVDVLIAQMAYDYRTSQGVISSVISDHLTTTRIPNVSGADTAKPAGLTTTPNSPSQPETHAPAADTSAGPLVDETTDDAKGLSSLALASSVEPIQPSPLPGDSVDGAGIPPNRAPTPSAAFSAPGKIETALKAATKARRARLGVS